MAWEGEAPEIKNNSRWEGEAPQDNGNVSASDVGKSFLETPLSLITGAAAFPIAKVGGAAMAAYQGMKGNPNWGQEAQEFENFLNQHYTYQPESETGKGAVETAGKVMSIPFKPAGMAGDYLTEKGYPNAGYVAKTAGEYGTMAAMPTVAKKAGGILSREGMAATRLDTTIEKGINKGIRPGIEGNRTYTQSRQYMGKAQNAVKTIIENKDNLRLTNDYGEVAPGRLPENLRQFSQAIDQTKRNIFEQYDALARESGESGAVVDLKPIAGELTNIIDNKVINDLSPGTVEYAKQRAEVFNARGSYTTIEAQDAIQHLNNSLEAFYKNPTYDTASKAYIDSLIANKLRQGLDSVIDNVTGENYQALKQSYGDLKTIEKDVSRRAIVDARKNTKGLIDFSDIFSGSEVVRGILSMNPSMVGMGVSAKLIASLYKHLNNPNRIIKRMFYKSENIMGKGEPAQNTNIPFVTYPGPHINNGNDIYDLMFQGRQP